jgi:ferredoxin
MKKVKVNQDTCIGCGACEATAPKTFKLNAQGKSVPKDPAGDDEETIQNAIDSCPVKAISWQD